MYKSVAGMVLISVAWVLSGVSASTDATAKQQWTAKELGAYLNYLQDGHEGTTDSQIVSLERSQVPEETIKKALDYKRRLDQSKIDLIQQMQGYLDRKK